MVCNSGTCTLDIADWDTQLCTTTIKVEKSQKVSSFLSCVLILQTRKLSKFKKIHFWCPSIQLSRLKYGFLCFETKSKETKRKSANIQIAWIWIRDATIGKTGFYETDRGGGSGIMPVMWLPLCLSSLQKIYSGGPVDECFVCLKMDKKENIFWDLATFTNTAIRAQRAAKLTCYCFGGHFDILSTTLLLQTSSSCLILAGVD